MVQGKLADIDTKDTPSHEVRVVARDLLRAARVFCQFPEAHPTAVAAVEGATAGLFRCLQTHHEISLALSGTSLLLNGVAITNPREDEIRFVSDLRKRYIRSITFHRGVTGDALLSLFRILGENPESLRERGGAKKALDLPPGAALELVEMAYEQAVTVSEAMEKGLISKPMDSADGAAVSLEEARPLTGFEQLAEMIDEPESLARLLQQGANLSWLEEIPVHGGGYGGEGTGDGGGSGRGDVLGGRGLGRTLAPEQVARFDVEAQGAVVLMTHLRDHLLQEGTQGGEVGRKLAKVIMACDPSFRGRLFRTPIEASGQSDVLSEAAEYMSDEELLGAAIPEPTILVADTSERMRRALTRCGARLDALAPLAMERLKQWALPEELYTNVVELIASEMEERAPGLDEAVPFSFAPEQRQSVAAEIITDLLGSVETGAAAQARAEVLVELLEKETDPEKYRILTTSLESAVEEMLEFQVPGLARRIVEALQSHAADPVGPAWRKRRASLALEELRKEAVRVKVEAGLENSKGEQVADLVFLLCLFGRVGAQRLIEILADDRQTNLHDAAADGLASLALQLGIPLSELAAALPWMSAAKVAARMAASGDEAALEQVAGMLRHRDWHVRRAAVEALGRARGRAVGLLIEALKDRDVDVRAVAVGHLANAGDPLAVPALLAVAGHGGLLREDQNVRERAVAALGSIGESATGALEQMLLRRAWIGKKAEESLSVAAARALGQIGTDEARAVLAQGAADTRDAVRGACLEAIAKAESLVSRILERDT